MDSTWEKALDLLDDQKEHSPSEFLSLGEDAEAVLKAMLQRKEAVITESGKIVISQ